MYPNRKLNEPSGVSSHPSYAGEAFWPREYDKDCAEAFGGGGRPDKDIASPASSTDVRPVLRLGDGKGISFFGIVAVPYLERKSPGPGTPGGDGRVVLY
jgi:hypothetical protein